MKKHLKLLSLASIGTFSFLLFLSLFKQAIAERNPHLISQIDIFVNPDFINNRPTINNQPSINQQPSINDQSASNNCSLTGRWQRYINGTLSSLDEITQTGNSLKFSLMNPPNLIVTVVGNKIEFRNMPEVGDFTATISDDCNVIDMGVMRGMAETEGGDRVVMKRYTAPHCPLTGEWKYTQYQPVELEPFDTHEQRRFSRPIFNAQIQITEDANGRVTIAGIPNTSGVAITQRNLTRLEDMNLPLQSGQGHLSGNVGPDEKSIVGYFFLAGEPGSGQASNQGSYRMVRLHSCPSQ